MQRNLNQTEVEERVNQKFNGQVIVISNYINRRSNIKLKCLKCGYEWETIAGNVINKYDGRCKECVKKERTNLSCALCGKKFSRSPHQIKSNKSGFFYCSRECGNKHKNILVQEEYPISVNNYRQRAMQYYPNYCAVCEWKEDIRILEVHHIDENRNNNDIKNLIILCPICHRKITLKYYILIISKTRKYIKLLSLGDIA